jgi:UDP-N-acetylglucosamine 4,6-dehydratase
MPLDGKTLLVTGGTGFFGRRFVEVVLARHRPRTLIVFSRDEQKQHEMEQALPRRADAAVRYVIGDVRDRDRLARACDGVDVVVHAAALKQIPACEDNPFEAVQTNILGTRNVIEAAIDRGVRKVLALSTDKAVNPINLYGATKLCAEKLVVRGNAHARPDGTRLSCARYGNVMGSRGSVVPKFLRQRANGTVTVTDERMTRFWITVDQGVDFVLECIEKMEGGEIFVPKSPSVRIMDLVRALASGCAVEFVGIRPGEKLHELLISHDEARATVDAGGVYVVKPPTDAWRGTAFTRLMPVPEGFAFASDTNERWLSAKELRVLVEGPADAAGDGVLAHGGRARGDSGPA